MDTAAASSLSRLINTGIGFWSADRALDQRRYSSEPPSSCLDTGIFGSGMAWEYPNWHERSGSGRSGWLQSNDFDRFTESLNFSG